MPKHSLFPNSITIHYTTNGHDHNMNIPVGAVSGSAPGWLLPTKDGGTVDWRTATQDFAELLADLISTSDSIDYADLFTYEATDGPAEFLASEPLDVAGTVVGAARDYVQAQFPFKAVGGNFLRLTLLEPVIDADLHLSYAQLAGAGELALVDFILSDDDWLITRGGTFPLVSLGMTTKVNDKLRKRYLLNA